MDNEQIRRSVIAETSPKRIFGYDKEEAKRFYRWLARICHPDATGNDSADAMTALNTLWDAYDPSDLSETLGVGNIYKVILTRTTEITKELRNDYDHDLMMHEIHALKTLNAALGVDKFHFFPILEGYDSSYIVLSYPFEIPPVQLASLEQIVGFYGKDLNIFHLGWIWHRLVLALDFAHSQKLVHGMVTPDHILLGSSLKDMTHDLFLIDWTNSDTQRGSLSYLPNKWKFMYPDDKQLDSAIPELDIFLAAQSMMWAFPHMPLELRQYYRALCSGSLMGIISHADTLNNEFDRRIYKLLAWRKQFYHLDWPNWEHIREEVLR